MATGHPQEEGRVRRHRDSSPPDTAVPAISSPWSLTPAPQDNHHWPHRTEELGPHQGQALTGRVTRHQNEREMGRERKRQWEGERRCFGISYYSMFKNQSSGIADFRMSEYGPLQICFSIKAMRILAKL